MIIAEYATSLKSIVNNYQGFMGKQPTKPHLHHFSVVYSSLLLMFIVLPVAGVCLPSAEAALVGEAELGYVSYDADVNGAKAIDASTFKQRYSLLYSTKGQLAAGRLGSYRVALGYEWAAFDTKLKTYSAGVASDDDMGVSAGHVLYRGEIKLDPRQLPLTARIYSFDLNRGSFLTDLNVSALSTDKLLSPGITTSLRDGTRISSGVTVDVGIKGGASDEYNAIFRHVPRLFIDYRDDINQDLKGFSKEDNRLRRLAFVSLNKKDNWFHVRTTNYTNYLDPTLSYKETQILLGTVDQGLQRKWVDFSNWIKVSADGQFTKHIENEHAYEFYELNLFGIASRRDWEAKTYNTFRRMVDGDGVTYDTKLPLYLTGYVGIDTDWRVRLSTEQTRVKSNNPYDATNTIASYRFDTFKRERFTLMHSATVNQYDHTQNGKSLSINAHVETASTRKLSSIYGLFASYDLTTANNEPVVGKDGTSVTQVINAKGVYTPTNSLKMELAEAITIASGDSSNDLTGLSSSSGGSLTGVSGFSNPTNSYIRYRTTARADWQPVARLRLGFMAADDQLREQSKPAFHGIELEHSLDYVTRLYKFRFRARYTTTDQNNISSDTITAEGSVNYSPDRSLESSIFYGYANTSNSINTGASTVSLKQNTNYYVYTDNGVSRRILELNQVLEYDRQTYSSYRQTVKSIIGAFKYYPLSRLYIGGRAKYSLLSYEGTTQNIYNATIGFNFNLMQASLDYSYGRQNGGGNRLERRFEANVKKTF